MKTKFLMALFCLFPLLVFAQNYEQQGDELFGLAQYEKAVKKYDAAIELGGESELLVNKKKNASTCFSLLVQAQIAERNAEISKALQFYNKLYELHPTTKYKSKIDSYKRIIDEQKDLAKHKHVDLGLSVKWATCNVGADKPEEFGDYFAWGEIKPKAHYDWTTYTWCNGSSSTLTKYNYNKDFGIVDNKMTLDKTDDAAAANWGGKWRMPTDAEWIELCEQCTWIWTSQNGVKGYKVISKLNGNSIFLPAAGFIMNTSLRSAGNQNINDGGTIGDYWSSSLYSNRPDYACREYFRSTFTRGTGYESRHYGFTIRPVYP